MLAFYRLVIRLNNAWVRARHLAVPPGNLLLLMPHCLRRKACEHPVATSLDACRRCGACDVCHLLALRDEFGIQCRMAGGGREALAFTRQPDVRVIVATACERELVAGICAAFPKPVLAVTNQTPNGPCRDTRVAAAPVRAAILGLLHR